MTTECPCSGAFRRQFVEFGKVLHKPWTAFGHLAQVHPSPLQLPQRRHSGLPFRDGANTAGKLGDERYEFEHVLFGHNDSLTGQNGRIATVQVSNV